MKNILMTCPWDRPAGGVVYVFHNLAREFKQRGIATYLVYPGGNKAGMTKKTNSWGEEAYYYPFRGVVGRAFPLSVLAFLACLPHTLITIMLFIKNKKIDTINCHYLSQYLINFAIAAKIMKTKLITSVHGADIDRLKKTKFLERLILETILRLSDQVVACSSYMAEETIRAFPKVKEKATFVHNGFSISEFKTTQKSRDIDSPFILTICHQVEKKGVDTLLKAFEIVQRKFPNLRLMIIGDGPLLSENKAMSINMGLEKMVKFLGRRNRDEIKIFISECALFVLPSREEPFGIVLLEASFYKKGIISTKAGGIPEIINDGVSGILVDPKDYIDMANRIIYLLENPYISNMLGRKAYCNLIQNFLWQDKAEDYMRLFEDKNHA